ncbi:MAG: PAS domain S-box protein [Acidobacteriota bacterium]|nr:PAS domain S-box protein [Acidobacteriota bacterium]
MTAELAALEEENRKLRRENRRYSDVLGSELIATAIHVNGRWVMANKTFTDLLGYESVDALIGCEISRNIVPEEKDIVAERIRDTMETGAVNNYWDEHLLRADGTVIDVEITGIATMYNGMEGVQILVNDISKRKTIEKRLRENETRFQALLDNAPFCLHELDTSGKLLHINPSGLRMMEIDRPTDVVGRSFFELFQPPYTAMVRERFAKAIQGRYVEFEYCLARDGRQSYHASNFIPIPGQDGRIERVMGVTRDVTGRRRMEEEIIERELRFRQITENMDEVFWLTKPVHQELIYVSPAFYKIWGRTAQELHREPSIWRDSLHPEDRNRIIHAVKTRQVAGTYDERYRILRPDGEVRWVHERAYPISDDSGEIYRITGIVEDVTGRKRAEDALLESENRLRQIIDLVPHMLFAKDQTGRFLMINHAVAEAYGLATTELTEQVHREIGAIEDKVRPTPAQDLEVLRTGRPLFIPEEPFTDVKGYRRILQTTKIPFSDRGRPAVLGIAVDITERRLAEERNQALLAGIPDLMFVHDKDGKLLDYHGPAGRLYLPPEQFLGKNLNEILPEEVTETILAGTRAALGNNSPEIVEYSLILNERPTHHEARLVPYGEDLVLSIVRDVTERAEMEREREALESQLRHAQKLETIGTLAGGIAHDFNNMLAPILGFTEIALADLEPGSEVSGFLENVIKAARRAKQLVQQILTFSHAETKQERRPIKISAVINEAFQLLRASLPATIVLDLQFNTDDDVISGDPTQINQVIINLCANSRQAIGDNPGTISMELERVRVDRDFQRLHPNLEEGTWLRLSVQDTGCGMDETTVARIFEPFFTTKEVGAGTGLGLSVIHGIVHSHEGVIEVSSEIGEGTRFEIYLPPLDGVAAGLDDPDAEPARGQEKILLVDDEALVNEMADKMLTQLGYRVTSCRTGEEALDEFGKKPEFWDLVITDQTMPGISGLILASRIRALRRNIPIILTTGYSEIVNDKTLSTHGIAQMIYKPFNAVEIGAAIRKVLGARTIG